MADFTYRILVVDDDPSILTTSRAVLDSQGYEVRTASNGFEALAMMRKALPDVIVSDLSMPNMSGFEFLSIVRRRFPQIPVIAISGAFAGPDVPIWVLADAFAPKGGTSPGELLRTIADLLRASPIRAQAAKPDKAPVWIPRNGAYFVVTCPDCLRSFSLPSDEFPDKDEPNASVAEQKCIHCGVTVRFVVEPLHSAEH